jgi:pimeloyl-ACP methyl ester carboxylesterase
MLRVVKGAALATVAALGMLLATGASALAAPSPVVFTPCPNTPGFGCAQLTVPLDPSGVVPGTVTLQIERKVAVTGTATQAVVAFAGGPGQAALPFAAQFAQDVAPALGTHDLIVFDQRGTGSSQALSCPAFTAPAATLTPSLVTTCADQLGTARGFYETDDSVADIEAIRESLGYSQLVLYGTSYGTKVALRYAEQYPTDVAGLLLDSTVAPNGPDVYSASTFAAIPGMLRDLCAQNACTGITANPVATLDTVVGRLNVHSAHATVIGDSGHIQHVTISPADILNILVAGDLDPLLRADLPAALEAAAHKDYALLATLDVAANEPEGGIDDELYFATTCEELAFPWTRGGTPAQLAAEALAAFKALPPATFAPFNSVTAYDSSDAPYCAAWPFETAAPESTSGTLPNVPTLILSGAEDLRTPTADAEAVAAQIPDAKVLVVPNTGHSVLGSDPTSCSQNAVTAFFNNTPIEPCSSTTIPYFLQPVPLPPESIGALRPADHTSGLPGRTVSAVLDTLSAALNESVGDLLTATSLSATVRFGGLRAGWASFSLTGLKLHDFSYVPGITVTGNLATDKGTIAKLRIGGKHAASGELTFNVKTHVLSGTLGGVHVRTSSKTLSSQAEAAVAKAAPPARAG